MAVNLAKAHDKHDKNWDLESWGGGGGWEGENNEM